MPQAKSVDVLFLSHRHDIVSGAEKSLLELIEYLVSIKKTVHVIIGDNGDITQHLDNLGVSYSIVHNPFWARGGEDPTEFNFTQPWNPSNDTVLAITNLIRSLNPKICVTNTIVTPWLAYSSAITSTPHVWMVHELHTKGLNLRYAIDKSQVLKSIDILSDAIFYSSEYTASEYTPHMRFNPKAQVIFPAGVNPTLTTTSPSPFKTGGIKIISVGQIKEQKGQIDIVKAATDLKNAGVDFEILLVGGSNQEDQAYLNSLNDIITQHKLDQQVHFMGHASNPSSLMDHADISINSATNETFGRVTVEGMAAKTVVIGADSAGTAEIIQHEANGLLYQPGDYKQLAKLIQQLSENPKSMEKLANAAREHAINKYSNKKRFMPLVSYLDSSPKRSALDLSPLSSLTSDFSSLIAQKNTHPSIGIKLLNKARRLARGVIKRR